MIVVTTAYQPVIHAAAHARTLWPQVRGRAGIDFRWIVVVDGDPADETHQVEALCARARVVADTVLCPRRFVGYGGALARAFHQIPLGEPVINLDADILPSPDFLMVLAEQAARLEDSRLGILSGRDTWGAHRAGVGEDHAELRPGRFYALGLSLWTAMARDAMTGLSQAAMGDDLKRLAAERLAQARLRWLVSETAWIAEQPMGRD